jgi:hypothetical protein
MQVPLVMWRVPIYFEEEAHNQSKYIKSMSIRSHKKEVKYFCTVNTDLTEAGGLEITHLID